MESSLVVYQGPLRFLLLVDVVELAVLDEQGMPTESRAWAKICLDPRLLGKQRQIR